MQNADWWILNLALTSLLFACVVLTIQKWWKAAFLFVKVGRISLELRPEQSQAANAKSMLQSSDVLAILPMRFGTRLIFQPAFATAAAIERNQHQTKVVCPLQSIIIDY